MNLKKTILGIMLFLALALIAIAGPCVIDVTRYQFYEPEEQRFYHLSVVPMTCNKVIPFRAPDSRQAGFLTERGWGYWETRLFDN